MSFGPNPWQQAHWDWRAAGNFIGGGAGSGLLAVSALAPAALPAATRIAITLLGLALVAGGLFCVWLEIGRPLRALHVLFHPQRSWMTREAFVAALLFPCGLGVLLGFTVLLPLLGLLALAFMFCQGRILMASRGIPAWREPRVVALIMATALAEGLGLLLVFDIACDARLAFVAPGLALAIVLRQVVWQLYRQRLAGQCAPRAVRRLDDAGHVLQVVGTVLPLLLLAPLAAGALPPLTGALTAALAGGAVVAAGAWMKYCLITRAAYNQGFALTKLPVRGVPR